jgi:hypothetical protein
MRMTVSWTTGTMVGQGPPIPPDAVLAGLDDSFLTIDPPAGRPVQFAFPLS